MSSEIERKFFVNQMPDLSSITPKEYERYFLVNETEEEVRISRVDNAYRWERKIRISKIERKTEKKKISKEEFDKLKLTGTGPILRTRYDVSTKPMISIQIYQGKYKGLVRAEVEFKTIEDAQEYIPEPWMGKEITGIAIANDRNLVKLSDEEFNEMIKKSPNT